VETSTKEKEKENVLTDLELMNLKNVYLLDFEVFRKRIVEAKKKKLVDAIRNIRGIYSSCEHSWRLQMNKRRVWTQLV
jgi:hypothetical protein